MLAFVMSHLRSQDVLDFGDKTPRLKPKTQNTKALGAAVSSEARSVKRAPCSKQAAGGPATVNDPQMACPSQLPNPNPDPG